jgi:2-oxoglutarate dehydrogenase E2 component (dihydrolipoamide succinyltransferase)
MPVVDVLMFAEQKEGTESFVATWLKHAGDSVGAYEPIVEISTDKVSMEVPAPSAGVLTEILKNEGDPVAPGDLLARISTDGETSVPQTPAAPEVKRESVEAADSGALSPAVRRILKEHNLDASAIPPTGRENRLTYQDVADFIEKHKSSAKAAGRPAIAASRMVPHTPMRRAIATHMARSMQTAPHVTSVFEADLSAVLADRETRKASGEVPSITAYLVRATVAALRAVPEANAKWHDDATEIFDDFNIGIGTAIEGGLIVPVLHRAQSLTLNQIASRLHELTEKARAGTLSAEEVAGGTFTISNHGVSGSLIAAPIIIPNGQSAVLGAGKLQKRVVAVGDSIQVRPMMYVTLTIDHRVLDAAQTNEFLARLVEVLQSEPAS